MVVVEIGIMELIKLNNKLVYVIDIETDNLDYNLGSIVEIGIVLLNLENGKILPIFNSLIKEERFINPDAWIFMNSSLVYEEVDYAPKLESYFDRLQKLFITGCFTAFNQKFDFGWLESRGFDIPFKWHDPMLVLTPIMQLEHYYRHGFKYPKVEEAYFYLFQEKINEPHRAIEDATIEAKIIKKLYELGIINT